MRSSTGALRCWRIARPGRDQTSYGSEFWGLWVLTAALAVAAVPGDAWIDNLAIVNKGRAAWNGIWTTRRMLAAWWHLREKARTLQDSTLRWCPSHGKQPDWRPPAPFQEEEIRRLNDCADKEASKEVAVQWARGEPSRVGAQVIRDWASRALHRQHRGLVRQRQAAGFLGGPGGDAGRGGDDSRGGTERVQVNCECLAALGGDIQQPVQDTPQRSGDTAIDSPAAGAPARRSPLAP